MTGENLGDLLDRLGETALECRALIREMHEANQDLKATIKEAERVGAELAKTVRVECDRDVGALLNASVKEAIDELNGHTKEAMRYASRKIVAEFDRLAEPLYKTLGMMDAYAKIKKDREPG